MIAPPWGVTLSLIALLQTQPADTWAPEPVGSWVQSLVALVVVSAVLALWVWVMRRGTFRGRGDGAVIVETAVALGDRRSLVIVSIEGRRLLLGLTPASVSLVTALDAPEDIGFADAVGRAGARESSVTQ